LTGLSKSDLWHFLLSLSLLFLSPITNYLSSGEENMSLEFNEKGKYFTDIISKSAVPAIIQTTMHRIEGFIHIRLDGRLKDELDRNESFLAVTNARVFNADGTLLFETDFLSVSRLQIIWVIPRSPDDPVFLPSSSTPGDQK
jgi:hypothetical protein